MEQDDEKDLSGCGILSSIIIGLLLLGLGIWAFIQSC